MAIRRPSSQHNSKNSKGPDSHELIVIKAQSPRLPLRREGMTVDEGSLEHVIPGLLEPESPGTHRLKLHLTPGRYELICFPLRLRGLDGAPCRAVLRDLAG